MSVAGTWNMTIATPMGAQAATLELIDTAGVVTGVATSGDDAVTLDTIAVDGKHLKWEQEVTKPFKVTVKFDVEIDGDTMAGTAKPGMFPASKVTGNRQT